jgi:lipopolysaccharide export system permease protein
VFTALIGWMYYRVAFVPGGQAIGALESGYAKAMRRLRALVKRRERREMQAARAQEAAAGAA